MDKLVVASNNPPTWKLTGGEMQERCKKDLCYNCDKKYEFGHTCKKLFMLEVLGDEEVEQ